MKTTILCFLATSACSLPLNGTGPIDNSPSSTSPTSTTDAEAEAAAPPINGDLTTGDVCHSANVRGAPPLTRMQCPSGGIVEADVVNNNTVAYATTNTSGGCHISSAPVECSTCEYTCDCLLKYVASPDAGCTCSQDGVGSVIVISGCP